VRDRPNQFLADVFEDFLQPEPDVREYPCRFFKFIDVRKVIFVGLDTFRSTSDIFDFESKVNSVI